MNKPKRKKTRPMTKDEQNFVGIVIVCMCVLLWMVPAMCAGQMSYIQYLRAENRVKSPYLYEPTAWELLMAR